MGDSGVEVEFDSHAEAWHFYFLVALQGEPAVNVPQRAVFGDKWVVKFWVPSYWEEYE